MGAVKKQLNSSPQISDDNRIASRIRGNYSDQLLRVIIILALFEVLLRRVKENIHSTFSVPAKSQVARLVNIANTLAVFLLKNIHLIF